VLVGPVEDVERMGRWCRVGPRGGRLTDVQVDREEPEGLESFEVRH
jgi:acylphosphatase